MSSDTSLISKNQRHVAESRADGPMKYVYLFKWLRCVYDDFVCKHLDFNELWSLTSVKVVFKFLHSKLIQFCHASKQQLSSKSTLSINYLKQRHSGRSWQSKVKSVKHHSIDISDIPNCNFDNNAT